MNFIYKTIISLCKNSIYNEETSSAVQKIDEESKWGFFLEKAAEHCVIPIVYECLEKNYKRYVPDHIFSELKNKYLQISLNNINKTKELVKILEISEKNNIQALAFKGPVLSHLAYGNITRRQFSDIDLIVDIKNVHEIKSLLKQIGYNPQFSIKDEYRKFYLDYWYYENFHSDEAKNSVDLHWRSEKPIYSFSIDFSDFKQNSFQTEIFNFNVKTVNRELNLIYLCQHGCKHGWMQLLWILDLHMQIRNSREICWELILEKAVEYKSMKMLKAGLLLTHRIFKTDLPDRILEMIYSDAGIVSLTDEFIQKTFSDKDRQNGFLFLKSVDLFYLKTMSSNKDKLSFLLSFFSVTPLEWKLGLPVNLYFIYYFYRPFRLLKRKLLNK